MFLRRNVLICHRSESRKLRANYFIDLELGQVTIFFIPAKCIARELTERKRHFLAFELFN